MKILNTKDSVQQTISQFRSQGLSVGFVPTMGALHEGHLSLIRESRRQDDITIASIYVNPSQFNNREDLKNYPRDLKTDSKLLSSTGCHIIFAPDDKEMYPEEDVRNFDFGHIEKIMEGKHRPGHFTGVAKIVTKLFDVVMPDRAYFGKKDFQQLAIIKRLTAINHYKIAIVECPIVREPDGLAMSSRNLLLTPEHRKAAPLIYHTLKKARSMTGKSCLASLKSFVENTINAEPLLKTEYFEIVDTETLRLLEDFIPGRSATGCVAVFAGKVRLIDNIDFIL